MLDKTKSKKERQKMKKATYSEVVPSKLIPYENNSRTHTDEQVNQVAFSITEFGFTNPILVDEKYGVIAGHCRLLAAQKLKLKKVPIITMEGLTEAQKRAYVIADNQLALNGGWDMDMLRTEFQFISDENFDLDLLGFDDLMIENLSLDEETGDALAEWEGMPEFEQENKESFRHVIVHFTCSKDVKKFFNLIKQKDTGKTVTVWYPPQKNMETEKKRY